MKKLLLGLVCAGLVLPQSAQAAKDYVNRFYVGGRCTVVVTTIFEMSNETSTRDYTCDEYDEMEAYYRRRNALWDLEAKEKAAAEAFKKELDSAGLSSSMLEVIEIGGRNKYYPDKVAKALSELSRSSRTVSAMKELMLRAAESRLYKDHPTMIAYVIGRVLEKVDDYGLGSYSFTGWSHKMMTNKCGKRVPVFIATLTNSSHIYVFGLTHNDKFDFIHQAYLDDDMLPDAISCDFL
ncbi:MAG: hypothetical protein CVV27_10630 [Candidatus Melainabacteria bacterium HGW-Melainabacteria-1]|nr:MAG: hypothetical protein CVV27_10630 [Candidatus Melainabacteria bacterium HGW-Melainabacteria-1]